MVRKTRRYVCWRTGCSRIIGAGVDVSREAADAIDLVIRQRRLAERCKVKPPVRRPFQAAIVKIERIYVHIVFMTAHKKLGPPRRTAPLPNHRSGWGDYIRNCITPTAGSQETKEPPILAVLAVFAIPCVGRRYGRQEATPFLISGTPASAVGCFARSLAARPFGLASTGFAVSHRLRGVKPGFWFPPPRLGGGGRGTWRRSRTTPYGSTTCRPLMPTGRRSGGWRTRSTGTSTGVVRAGAKIANERRDSTLTDLRTCLFFECRRWRHYGDDPDEEDCAVHQGPVGEDQGDGRRRTGRITSNRGTPGLQSV